MQIINIVKHHLIASLIRSCCIMWKAENYTPNFHFWSVKVLVFTDFRCMHYMYFCVFI